MNTTAPRVNPQQMAETEMITESRVEDLDGGGDEAPAAATDALPGTAGTNRVVVCHVDIKNELPVRRNQRAGAQSFLVARFGVVDGTDLKTAGVELAHLTFEIVSRGKGIVADICIAGQCEGEFTMGEEASGRMLVIEPCEDRLERIETTIERKHYLRRGRVVFYLHAAHCHRGG